MQRRLTTQDITWFIDLDRNQQLDLDPPYQRRSVWTRKDKQFFLDTIFRNFPSPAIFLHKTISEEGKTTYHVVDGKQRTQTILDFVANKIPIAKSYGDIRLDGKRWSDLQGDSDLKKKLWNYQITVEMIDFPEDSTVVNEIFDRLNRNSRKLTPQELRHAKYDGWLISVVESESEREEWRELGIVTTSRARRMADSQFISELLLVLLEKKIMGFDQDILDELYAKYNSIADDDISINEDDFKSSLEQTKQFILSVHQINNSIAKFTNVFANFYTLWTTVCLNQEQLPDRIIFAERYDMFISRVAELSKQEDLTDFLQAHPEDEYKQALTYLNNARGASTDQKQRENRHSILTNAIIY